MRFMFEFQGTDNARVSVEAGGERQGHGVPCSAEVSSSIPPAVIRGLRLIALSLGDGGCDWSGGTDRQDVEAAQIWISGLELPDPSSSTTFAKVDPPARPATGKGDDSVVERIGGHDFLFTPTGGEVAGMKLYRVRCETCDVELHPATTSPQSHTDPHLRKVATCQK